MMKSISALGVFLVTIALTGITAHAAFSAVDKVISVPGADQAQLSEKVKTWAGMYGRSNNVDDKTGVVVVDGEVSYPSPPVDRIQYTILFEMKNKIEGNKVAVTFDKVMLKSPVNYVSSDANERMESKTSAVENGKDTAAADKVLSRITGNLEAFLLGKSDTASTLFKCADCAVLSTSEGELGEHMKIHSGGESPPAK